MSHPTIQHNFAAFFENWLFQRHCYLQRLLENSILIDKEANTSLVDQILCHYKKYYDERAKLANEDISLFFSSTWCYWVAGFRGSWVFRIVWDTVGQLSVEQLWRMERVKAETQRGEIDIDNASASIQYNRDVILGLLSRVKRLADGEDQSARDTLTDGEVQSEEEILMDTIVYKMKNLKEMMVQLVANTDAVREWTVREVVGILSPTQRVRFLTAFVQFY
ncbi:protein DOG1-like 4 [Cornus florida]|uniref:protein DOG1-like 4 n=1 Tax=Cornus florida TaxID=4283 RepID=UPI0028A15FFF|nr:protein DOG1-like 4 [Cornus florida]